MKFNWLRFLYVVCVCIVCACSQSVFAEDTTTDGQAKCKTDDIVSVTICAIQPGQYISNNKVTDCPKFEWTLYEFIENTEVSSDNIESCAIKLKTGSSICGAGTNVVYVYDAQQEAYVRKDNYTVYGAAQSVPKEDKDLPSDIIKDVDSGTVDYCKACPNNQYNINGECGYCHSGHCVSDEGACEICPAGFACPGDGDIEHNNTTVMCSAAIECGQDEYAESGSSQCSECAMGYSTYASGPASEVTENNVKKTFDGSCKARQGGFGIQCIASEACKSIPAQLCYKPKCACDEELANTSGGRKGGKINFILERLNCKSSYSLGDNKVWGPVNTKVVQTLRKNNY